MSAQTQEQRQQVDERRLELLKALFGGGQEQQAAQQTQNNIITGLDVTKLIRLVFEERPEYEEERPEFIEMREEIRRAQEIAREFVDVYIKDGLARILHPKYGVAALVARFMQTCELLRREIRLKWTRVKHALITNEHPEKVAEYAKDALNFTRQALLVAVSIYDKLLTLLYVNAPAEARPPLATLSLGYELLRVNEEWEPRRRRRR